MSAQQKTAHKTAKQKEVDFGFQQVSEDEKTAGVRGVFASVAAKYDVMNDAMSFGVHRLWKREFIKRIAPQANWKALDCAGGTGDIAFALYKKGVRDITVCDPSAEMMGEGQNRAIDRGILDKSLSWVEAPAEKLPFDDNTFDLVTISFGLRNVTDRPAALAEFYRVLKPGGAFYCLEFSQVQLPGLDKVYEAYSFNVIPKLGGLIADDEASYKYLVESIARFPTQEQLEDLMRGAGFQQVIHSNMSGGIVAIHKGIKI